MQNKIKYLYLFIRKLSNSFIRYSYIYTKYYCTFKNIIGKTIGVLVSIILNDDVTAIYEDNNVTLQLSMPILFSRYHV